MIRRKPKKIPYKEVHGDFRLGYGEEQGFEEAIIEEDDEE